MSEPTQKAQNMMNLSFAGCGFLGMYYVGVASCIREYAPQVLLHKIAGASAGALVAVALLCNVPFGESTSDILKMVVKARKNVLGPFHPGFDVTRSLKEGLEKMLPPDAYIRCSGRMHISVTRFSDWENVILTNFNNNEELISALLCSCFVPFYSGFVPLKFKGVAYVDGGFTDNLPILDENTVTISPFSGESDICPQDNYFNFLQVNLANTSIAISPNNLYRLARVLFPPTPEVLSRMCQQGFDDALKFLQRNNMSSCTRCLAVQSSFILSPVEPSSEMEESESTNNSDSMMMEETEDEMFSEADHTYDDCKDCRQRLQLAVDDTLPDGVVSAIQDACDQLNKGLVNWLFRQRPVKFIYFMAVPYVLPFDISVAMLKRIIQMVPKAKNEMQHSFWNLMNFAKNLVHKFDTNRHLYSAKFSCQLAITEYNYSEEEKMVAYNHKLASSAHPTQAEQLISQECRSKSRSLESLYDTKRVQKRTHPAIEKKVGSPSLIRKSLVELHEPERVISKMNFGFTVGVSSNIGSAKNKRQKVMEAFKTLGNENTELSAINMANKALNLERECMGVTGGRPELHSSESFESILDATNKHEALVAFYYMDKDNRVKVTEIFNVTEADTSAILTKDEREVNEGLQWDSDEDWGDKMIGEESFRQSSIKDPAEDKTVLSDEEIYSSSSELFQDDDDNDVISEPDNTVSITENDFCNPLADFKELAMKRNTSFAIAHQ